jgi:hypothetical protein
MLVMKRAHAECADCWSVVHFPYMEASSVEMAATAWGTRLRQGCSLCGGPLRRVTVEPCAECDEFDGLAAA